MGGGSFSNRGSSSGLLISVLPRRLLKDPCTFLFGSPYVITGSISSFLLPGLYRHDGVFNQQRRKLISELGAMRRDPGRAEENRTWGQELRSRGPAWRVEGKTETWVLSFVVRG